MMMLSAHAREHEVDPSEKPPNDSSGGFVPVWKQLEQTLREWVTSGQYPAGSKFPPDRQIAEILGANRLTVRRALASLAQQGLLRVEHGVGTFVEKRIAYSFGERVRFNENVKSSNASSSRKVLKTTLIEADRRIADMLGVSTRAPVIQFELVGLANDAPISAGQKYVAYDRFPSIIDAFEKDKSFSSSFKRFGVDDYKRKFTHIVGRFPTEWEAKQLIQPKNAIVLGFESLDVDLNGIPVSYQEGCYSADRVMLAFQGSGA